MVRDKLVEEQGFAALYLEQLQLNKQLNGALYLKLLEHFGSAAAILACNKAELEALQLKPAILAALYPRLQIKLNPNYLVAVQTSLDYCAGNAIEILAYGDTLYPELLKQIYQPPPLLYCLGDSGLLSQSQIAIVGARKASQAGLDLAHKFAHQLALNGWIITSGLALGIDASAHQGALAAQGKTLAVLPCGIDLCYPARHKHLAEQILQQGLIISEFALGSRALKNHFPRRNRLISGLSLGTLVVEAQPKSGSLITARLALEQNREVFALPAGVNNPYGQGCNQLIQMGAKLVTQVSDIEAEFEAAALPSKPDRQVDNQHSAEQMPALKLSPLQQRIFLSLLDQPLSLEALLLQHSIGFFELQQQLSQLELLGLIRLEFGCYNIAKVL